MYKCLECDEIFEEAKTYSEDYTPGGASEGGSFIYRWQACPCCEGAYREARVCDACGEYEVEDDGEYIDQDWLCKKCLENLEEE